MRRPLWQKVCTDIPFASSLACKSWRTIRSPRLKNRHVMESASDHELFVCVSRAIIAILLQVCNKESACDTAAGSQSLSPQQW